jgi:imidazoleglycerol-phosphate dehydratase
MREAEIERQTSETSVRVKLKIDGSGRHQIGTGLGFFDHMLAQIAVHGLFDLDVEAKGDLRVDPHHTVEDCALVIGEALHQALGERQGIVRAAAIFMPMDEALGRVVVDLSGRPYAVVSVGWNGSDVGRLPTSLIEHFFESLAVAARCNLHAAILYGRDNHHMTEALFKGLGRALDAATQIDPRRADRVPSSKGRLV